GHPPALQAHAGWDAHNDSVRVKAPRHMEILGVVGALVLLLTLAHAPDAVAGAQSKDERKPGELWNTYPLDPSGDQAQILGRPQTARQIRWNHQPAAERT